MRNVLGFVLFGAVLVAVVVSTAVAEKQITIVPLEGADSTPMHLVAPLDNGSCWIGNLNPPAYWVSNLLRPPEAYKLVFDPTATCTACTLGFSVISIHLGLYTMDSCTVVMSVDLEGAVYESPGCYAPGPVLCSTGLAEMHFPYAGVWDVGLPVSPCDCPAEPNEGCFSMATGPYCLSVHFESMTCSSSDIGPITDEDPCQYCRNWNNYGGAWFDIYAYYGWWPGQFTFFAEVNCCEPPPQCDIDPDSLCFDMVGVGGYLDKTFTITNVGGGTLTGDAEEACCAYRIVSGGGAYSLGPGETKQVTVRFAPMSLGLHTCDVAAGIDCPGVACTGTGVPVYCSFECWNWATACLGGWNRDASSVPACVRDDYFADAFPSGLVIGVSAPGRYTAKWTTAAAVEAFGCGYGLPRPLTGDYVDPARGQLGSIYGEIMALRLNREFSCGGYFSERTLCYGTAVVPPEVPKFAGLTVDQLLGVADQALGGNASALIPYGNNPVHLQYAAAYMNWLYGGCGRLVEDRPLQFTYGDTEAPDPSARPLPEEFSVTSQPNPLHTDVTIRLALPAEGNVSLELYDVQGRRIVTVAREPMAAGYHEMTWNGSDASGSPVAPGVYFLRVEVDGQVVSMQKLAKL